MEIGGSETMGWSVESGEIEPLLPRSMSEAIAGAEIAVRNGDADGTDGGGERGDESESAKGR